MFILGHSRQACPHEMHCSLCIQIISPQFEQIHFLFSFLTKDLMPFVCISFRLWRTLTPYLDVYRFSKWLIWAHGSSSQLKQYLKQPLINFSQFFIRQATQDFDLKMSSRQPGHAFIFLICARQRRQFIPQGAINLEFVFFNFVIMTLVVWQSFVIPQAPLAVYRTNIFLGACTALDNRCTQWTNERNRTYSTFLF